MQLTQENYFSQEASREYMSVSQYKGFVGTLGQKGCEEKALATLRGDWKQEMTVPLLIGSYVDAHFEGTLDVFKAKNPEIFKGNGDLKSIFETANEVIARIERDPYFMLYLSGEKQVIFTGEIFGIQWKCKIDSLLRGICITDLKVMADLKQRFWVKDLGTMSFVQYWGYDIQGAIYRKLVEINTGKEIPFYIAAASKEKYPDIEIIGFTPSDLEGTLSMVFTNVGRINDLKQGRAVPTRCEECDYCRATKVLTAPIHYSKLIY